MKISPAHQYEPVTTLMPKQAEHLTRALHTYLSPEGPGDCHKVSQLPPLN